MHARLKIAAERLIDAGSEILIDCSRVRAPNARLLLAAIGQPLAKGSPWVAVSKDILCLYPLPFAFLAPLNWQGIAA